jgi:hypothetical protein
MGESTTVYCYYHPNVPTALRCNRCEKPICARDAVRTPTGYRCKECVRQQQDAFFNARQADYAIAALVALPTGFLAQRFVPQIGFFVLLIGPALGGLVGEAIWRATGRRRGRYTWVAALAGLSIGALAAAWPSLRAALAGAGFGLGLLWHAVFFVFMAGAIVARLRFWK